MSAPRLCARDAADALATVDDPEVGLDVVSLGLVYAIDVQEGGVSVALTLTTPACPMSRLISREAVEALRARGFARGEVQIVWSPPWSPAMIDPDARAAHFGPRR